METIPKIVRALASLPLVGGVLVFVLGFLPLLLIIPLNLSNGLTMVIGGLLMAAWCYFLNVKKIINIVTPLIPIPLWILGIVMALAGVYGMATNKWDDSATEPKVINESIQPSGTETNSTVQPREQTESESENKPENKPERKPERKIEPAEVERNVEQPNLELEHLREGAAESVVKQLEKSLEGMKALSETLGKEQFEKVINSNGNSEETRTLEDVTEKIQQQIDELKSQGHGSGESE